MQFYEGKSSQFSPNFPVSFIFIYFFEVLPAQSNQTWQRPSRNVCIHLVTPLALACFIKIQSIVDFCWRMERASAPESAVATQQELEDKKKSERGREQVSYYPIKHKHVYSGIKASSKDTSNNIKSLHFFFLFFAWTAAGHMYRYR